jgi:hypothetical protein
LSKIALSGNASGTGTFTIASPNSNSDRTLNLPDNSGTVATSGISGVDSVPVGRGAGNVSTNTAVGAGALSGSNTGANNTIIGFDALKANTTGASNTVIGSGSLSANTTGGSNTTTGFNTLLSNTTGANNTAVGRSALQSNTTGGFNIALGRDALVSNTTASNTTAVGYQAGYTSTGQRNAFFGSEAGYSNTTGESNTYIGRQAGYSMTTGNNNTIIGRYNGNQGGLDIRTASNHIVLSDGDGNIPVYFNGSGTRFDVSYGDPGLFYLPTSCRAFGSHGGSGITAIASGTINTGFIHVIETGTTKYFIGVYYKTAANDPVVTALASNGLSVGATNSGGTVLFNGATNNANVKMRSIQYNVGFGL